MQSQSDSITKYFGYESRFSNLLFKVVLVFVIAQQIYLPQKLKYFHLGMLFVYMIFLGFFKDEYRTFNEEYAFIATVLGCSIVSIFEGIGHVDWGILYLLILLLGIMLTFRLMLMIFKKVYQNEISEFTLENQKMLEKGSTFIKVLLIAIMATLIASFLYGSYGIIIRL